jgi:hypothetical protein
VLLLHGFPQNRHAWRGVPADLAAAHAATLEPSGALEAAIEGYRASAGGLGADATAPIRMPTLYLWGTEDHTVGRVAAEGTAAHGRPSYRFVEIEGAGHYLPEHVPERVAGLLGEHLARWRSGGSLSERLRRMRPGRISAAGRGARRRRARGSRRARS